ncbi:hypothetical protein PR048_004918 [Dryococelus australis]|uniref:Uncharacterized protein n=1 Tax=Dryococelus australis TaxID=614101 RepID=A0ABQ9I6R3_9NEOP|nr:hypothetical protein PR048_004918 [Dryococelus australis]
MKRNRPSGMQQSKNKGKALNLQSLAGSLLKFVTSSDSTLTSSVPEESNIRGDGQDKLDFEGNRVLSYSDSSLESEEQTQIETDNQERQDNELITKEHGENSLRVDLFKRGSEVCQNKDGQFGTVTRSGDKIKDSIRQLTYDWFYIILPNGEKILRTWMAYS